MNKGEARQFEQYKIDARKAHYANSAHDNSFYPVCTHPVCVLTREEEERWRYSMAKRENDSIRAKWERFWNG